MFRVTGKWPFSQKWPAFGAIFVIVATIGALYVWRLGTLTTGLSEGEVAARNESRSLSQIASNPIYAPYRILQHSIQLIGENGAFWLRLVSVIVALVLLYMFYVLIKLWFGRLIGILGALLLIGTPYMILSARSATPQVLLLLPVAALGAFVWLSRTDRKNIAWLFLIIVAAACLYIPGGFYFITAGSMLLFRPLRSALKQVSLTSRIIGLALLVVLLLPVALAILKHPPTAKEFLLVPDSFRSVAEALASIGWSFSALLWRAEDNFPLIVGRLPLLTSAQIILSSFGIYAMWKHARKELYVIFLAIFIGAVGAGLNNDNSLLLWCLAPFSVLAAAGLRYLYREWRKVFPLNPLPRVLAIVLLLSVVSVHLLYGVRYALIAWPQTIESKNSYMLK